MKAALPEPELVTKNGKPVSVILPIKQYQQILERLEDAEEIVWLKNARRKKLHCRPLEEVLSDLSRSEGSGKLTTTEVSDVPGGRRKQLAQPRIKPRMR